MANPVAAIYNALIASPAVAAKLASYDPPGAAPARPAVFSEEPPAAAGYPQAEIKPATADSPGTFESKNTRGREVFIDVYIYDRATGSVKAIDEAAVAVRDALHRASLSVPGADGPVIVTALGPINSPADERHFYARVVTAVLDFGQ